MSEEIENKLNKIPVVKQLVILIKSIKLKSLEGLSLYDILELYVLGNFRGHFHTELVLLPLVFLWHYFLLRSLF